MSNISIFQQKSTAVAGREVSELSKALADRTIGRVKDKGWEPGL